MTLQPNKGLQFLLQSGNLFVFVCPSIFMYQGFFFLTFLKTIKVHHLFYSSVVSFIWHHPGPNGFSFLVALWKERTMVNLSESKT